MAPAHPHATGVAVYPALLLYNSYDNDWYIIHYQVNFKAAGYTQSDFMRKGVVGDFKNYFDEKLSADFDQYIEDRLINTDFQFTFK